MNLEWYDYIGMAGTLIILGAFFLLQAGKLSGNGFVYQLLNLLGAVGILASLYNKFNLSVFLLEIAWIIVSLYGMFRSFRTRKPAAASATASPVE